jgi:alpha-1,6-mannosyltransferase
MKKPGLLGFLVALPCAVYLSVVLTIIGLDKFHYVLASGRKFATFPDLDSLLGISLSYIALGVIYLLWFFSASPSRFSRFSQVLSLSTVFLLIAYASYPLGSDIYLYLNSGLMTLADVNPFLVRAAASNTVLLPFVDWGQTSTYGPVSQLLFVLSAATVQISPIVAVYVFKAFCLGLHVLNGFLVWHLAPPEQRGKLSLAYLLNPLLLMEHVGSAHVDVLVSTSFLVLAGCLLKRHYSLVMVPLWVGFLAKTIPIIWIPLVGLFLLKQRQWKAIAIGLVFSAGMLALLWATVLPGVAAWQSLLNPGVTGQYMASIPALVRSTFSWFRLFSPASVTLQEEKFILVKLTQYLLIGFASFYAWTGLRSLGRSSYSAAQAIEDMGWVTLVLLLFATSWLMPWYASVLLAMALVIPQAELFMATTMMFSLSSSSQYLFQGHQSLRSLVTLALPLIVIVIGKLVLTPRSAKVTQSSSGLQV